MQSVPSGEFDLADRLPVLIVSEPEAAQGAINKPSTVAERALFRMSLTKKRPFDPMFDAGRGRPSLIHQLRLAT